MSAMESPGKAVGEKKRNIWEYNRGKSDHFMHRNYIIYHLHKITNYCQFSTKARRSDQPPERGCIEARSLQLLWRNREKITDGGKGERMGINFFDIYTSSF